MKKILLLLFVGASALTVTAQLSLGEQVKRARVKMLKETVEFLTNDTFTFKKIKPAKCNNCESIKTIQQFADDHKLKLVSGVVDGLYKSKIDSAAASYKAGLENFKNNIISRFYAGETFKTKRQKIPGYEGYKQRLSTIIGAVKPPAATAQATKPATTGSAKPDSVPAQQVAATPTADSQPGGAAGGDQEGRANVQADTVLADPKLVEGKITEEPLVTPLFLYVVIGLLLAGCIYFFLQSSKYKRQRGYSHNNNKALREQLSQLESAAASDRKALREYKEEIAAMNQEKENLQKMLEQQQKAAQTAKAVVPPIAGTVAGAVASEQAAANRPATPPTPKPVVLQKKYARYADTGDGFSESYLLDQPNNETIFEITVISPDAASFVVSGNVNVQKYALSNIDYFLSKTCQYTSFPSANSTITTNMPGKLRKEKGQWTISSPASISFN